MTSSTKNNTRMTTGELIERLRRHYIKPGAPFPGGVFLPEVGWNGGTHSTFCDAIYVGFTSSSGRLLVGHELKVSRADWLNELNKSGKADPWADQCHEWWLVVSDPSIVHDGELPAGWGLMSPGPSKTRMRIHQKPARKPLDHRPSWDAVRSIMARQDTLRAKAISQARDQAFAEATQTNPERIEAEVRRRLRDIPDAADIKARLDVIENAVGAPICTDDDPQCRWRHGHVHLADLSRIASAARTYGSLRKALEQLLADWDIGTLRRRLAALETAIEELRHLQEAG